MKILLRNRKEKVFYAGEGRWTPATSEAHDFDSGERAIETALKFRMTDLETVYYFGDPHLDLAVPIKAAQQR